jgi:hypothetical protein
MAKKSFPIAFKLGIPEEGADFTKEEVDKWLQQIEWWIRDSQVTETNPRGKAEKVMDAALHGRKLNGEIWAGIENYSLRSRIRQLCGWDIDKGVGRGGRTGRPGSLSRDNHSQTKAKQQKQENSIYLGELGVAEMLTKRDNFKSVLYIQFPWLDNPVYESKVNALAESEVRLASLSEGFLTAEKKDLQVLLEIREALRDDINDLMEMLSIHPKQLTKRIDETERGDVGSLVAKWQEMGKKSEDYENVDAIQELLQIIHQIHNLRVDGKSPQLADYMLWHKTGCAGHNFTCECGRNYELYRGFTKDELIEAAKQAYKVYGWGIKPVIPENPEEDKNGGREATTATDV